MVVGFAGLNQTGGGRSLVETLQQCPDGLEAEPRIAPIQARKRIELVCLDCLDDRRIQGPLLRRRAERAIAHMASRTTCNLSDLGSIEPARTTTVELANPGEGNVVDIHVKPHADRIGGDEVIDLAVLEHADLGVARSWTERTENDCCSTSLATDYFGQRKHVRDRK